MIAATVLSAIVSRSCANTQTPPSGGPKDTIPPVLLKVTPENESTNFPTSGGKIVLTFNEYTVVKNASDIYMSPPTRRRPTVKVKGKSVEVTLNDSLQANTTYTLDFGNALADNNEGNLFPRYVYSFSTGDEIDSLYMTGRLVDCEKLLPVKGALVALYTGEGDSICMFENPVAAAKTDDWGFFVVRNIKPVGYRIFAFNDKDGDSRYTIGTDKIAFYDSLYVPTKVIRDSVYELRSFNMKDTSACNARIADIELRMFQDYSTRQYILSKGRINPKMGYIRFAAANAQINSFRILGIDDTQIVTQFSPNKDSMNFWINESGVLPDSLMINLNYMKTDSLSRLVPTNETVIVAMTKEAIAESMTDEAKEKALADTVFTLNSVFDNTTVEQEGIRYNFEAPIVTQNIDGIVFTSTNPRNQTDTSVFTLKVDENNICSFVIQLDEDYQQGYKYELLIPENIFTDVYGRKNKSDKITFSLPNEDNFSTITLNFSNVQARYIIELVNREKTKTFRKFIIDKDESLYFPYVKSGTYSLRITEDRNGNGVFDSGDMFGKRQPEKVTVYKLADGSEVFYIPEQTDVIQDIIL